MSERGGQTQEEEAVLEAGAPRLPDREPRSRSSRAQQVGGHGLEPATLGRRERAWVCSAGRSTCSLCPGQPRRVIATRTSVPLPEQPRCVPAHRSWFWASEGVPAPKIRALKQDPHPRVAHLHPQTHLARGALFQASRPRPSFPGQLPPRAPGLSAGSATQSAAPFGPQAWLIFK